MSGSVESESVYEPYDPTLEFSHAAKNNTDVSRGPTIPSRSSAYQYEKPVNSDAVTAGTGTGTPPFPHLQSGSNDYGMLSNVRTEFIRIDTRYLRSLEGIMRFASLPLAFIGIVLAWVYVISGNEVWYAAQGSAYLIYVTVVFLIETLLAEVFVHRLVDGIITAMFAASWLSAAVALTYDAMSQFAVIKGQVPLGAPATFAYIEAIIVTFSAVLAFRTWKIYGGKNGSPALC